jgi:uncharacterized protein (DUF433 family)
MLEQETMTGAKVTDPRGGGDRFRFGKAYTIRQAARLADVAPASVRRWLNVYDLPERSAAPMNGYHSGAIDVPSVSFLELIEIVVVARFRRGRRSVKLDRLHRAHTFARERFGLPYPFASLSLRESGGSVLHEFDRADPHGPALALDLGGRWAMPGFVTRVLDSLDFSEADRMAERWFPAGRETPIVLDPRRGAGRLTVLGTGVTIETIYRRFMAGESIELLADDYDLGAAAIQEAIRYADRTDLAVA